MVDGQADAVGIGLGITVAGEEHEDAVGPANVLPDLHGALVLAVEGQEVGDVLAEVLTGEQQRKDHRQQQRRQHSKPAVPYRPVVCQQYPLHHRITSSSFAVIYFLLSMG